MIKLPVCRMVPVPPTAGAEAERGALLVKKCGNGATLPARAGVPDDPVELMLSAISAHFRSQAVIGNFYLFLHFPC